MKLSWLDYVKMLFRGKPMLEEAIKDGKIIADAHAQNSWKSANFWLAVATGVGGLMAQAGHFVPAPWGAIAASSSAFLYAIGRGIAKKDDPLGGVKPMVSRTEFWVNLLAGLGGVLSSVGGAVPPEAAAVLASIAAGAVSISDGLAKSGAQPPK